jgi:hypothetical protein
MFYLTQQPIVLAILCRCAKHAGGKRIGNAIEFVLLICFQPFYFWLSHQSFQINIHAPQAVEYVHKCWSQQTFEL